MNAEYCTVEQYIEGKSKLIGKIATYDILIEKMEEALLTSTVSGHLAQYELDDGFMKLRSNFRNTNDIVSSISGLEMLRQRAVNKLNGRSVRLVGGSL